MSIRVSRRALRRPMAAVLAVALVGAGLLAASAPASAATETVTSGSASWGIKDSFRTYIVNPNIANGVITPTDGATQAAGNGVFTFGGGTGAADTAAGTADVDFTGAVNFTGHGGDLDLTFSNPRLVALGDGTGTIFVDYAGTTYPAGTPIGGTDVALATLAGVTVAASGSTVTIASTSATLTAAGAPAFGGFYAAGAPIDPISATVAVLVPAVSTTTVLTAAPDSPRIVGTQVTLTATVTPSNAVGTVQFVDGTTNLGAPVAVSGGVASLPTTALDAATHSLTAQFIPADTALFTGSTSNAVSYTITAAPNAAATTTATVVATSAQPAGITPADPTTTSPALLGAAVTLSTIVAPAAAGTVQFTDNGTPIGSPATVDPSTGAASISISTLAAGGHSLRGTFSPADPAAFAPSTSAVAKAYGIANPATTAACVVGATNVALSNVSASWPISATVWAFATRTATGNIAVGATSFEFSGGTGTASSACTQLAFTGSFTAQNTGRGDYSFTFANPTITVAPNGSGVMVADVSAAIPGTQTSGPTRVTVATFTGATTTPVGNDVDFTVDPNYVGTVAAGTFSGAFTDAFPVPTILAVPAGVRGQLYQTADSQLNKVAGKITASYTYTEVPTSTGLAASPAKPAVLGSPVTLTATVIAATGSATGSVEFRDGATVLGTAAVSAGIATFATSSLVAGGHQLSAAFIGTSPYGSSASAAAHYGIADPAAPASCVVNEAKALPVTAGTFSWKVSNTVWAYPDKSATGNAVVGADAFSVTAGAGATDGLCTVVEHTGSFTAVNTNQGGFGFTFTDPTVSVAFDGSGTVVAGVSWANVPGASAPAAPVRVVVASFDGAATAPDNNAVSFSVTADYADSVALGTWSNGQNDAFPNQFLLALPSSVRAFFYASGSVNGDPNKPAGPVSAAWTIPTYAPQVTPSLGSVEQGQTVTFTGTGFAPNEPVAGVVNSDPVSLGSALASAEGTVAFTWTVPADFAVGIHSIVLTGATSASIASATFEVTAPPPACVARTVSGATLSWGVKSSFVNYITGTIAGGSYSTSGVTGQFTWAGGRGTANPASSLADVSYGGTVSFTGHGGLLQLTVANPTIQVTGPNSALLLLDVTSKSLDSGETTRRTGVAFATLALGGGSNSSTDDRIAYSGVPATLTAGGATVFAGFYPAGTALDAVSFVLPLGAEVPCTAAVDPDSSGSLASTGASATTHGLLAMLLLSIGAGLVLTARRRAI